MRTLVLIIASLVVLSGCVGQCQSQRRTGDRPKPPATDTATSRLPTTSQPKVDSWASSLVNRALNDAGRENWAAVIRWLDPAPAEREPGKMYAADWPSNAPYALEADFLLGRAYQAAKQWVNAQKWYQRYLEAAPNGAYANDCRDRLGILRRGYWDEALREVRAIVNDPKLGDEEKYSLGMDAISRARDKAPPGFADVEECVLDYAEGVLLDGVHRSIEARDRFRQYLGRCPSGRFTTSVLFYLSQYEKPQLLYIQGSRLRAVLQDGSETIDLTTPAQGEVRQAALSPARDYVAVLTWSPGAGDTADRYTVYVINLQNPKVSAPVWSCRGKESRIRNLSWSPCLEFPVKTRFLSFVGPMDPGDYYLWTWDAQNPTPSARPVAGSKTPPSAESLLTFSWAPQGACLALCGEDKHLYISRAPFESADSRRTEVQGARNLTWTQVSTSDGDPLLFGLSKGRAFVLNGKEAVVGRPDPRFLDLGKDPIDEMGVSSGGDVIGVLRKDVLTLYRVRDEKQLGKSVSGVDRFAFSPLGNRLAYRTNKGVYVSRLDDDRDHDIRLSGTQGITDFMWSPVGNQILWCQRDSIRLCFEGAELAGDKVAADASVTYCCPKWAVDDHAVAIQKTQEGIESIVLLVRGTHESTQQIRPLALNEEAKGGAHLVDWIR